MQITAVMVFNHGQTPLPAVPPDSVIRRSEQLDALDAIMPFDRRDQLAAILTDDDVETLKHLASEGLGDNTMRALASDLAYLEGWCLLASGEPLPWPAPRKPAAEIRGTSSLGSRQAR